MSSILKVDEIQDTSGNNIINENADTITIGASGDSIKASTGTNWVGTVAESTASSIVEKGSNSNGEFTKFADGTMICTKTTAELSISSTAPGNQLTIQSEVLLPISFVNTDFYSNASILTYFGSSPTAAFSIPMLGARNNFSDSKDADYFVRREVRFQCEGSGSVNKAIVSYIAIGRWY
jgi:hypothetical protein